ncbi:MAG: DNA integrity scanning protein DisA nucleotide-binding domain protein [Metamycoplasmataceae bacterium]
MNFLSNFTNNDIIFLILISLILGIVIMCFVILLIPFIVNFKKKFTNKKTTNSLEISSKIRLIYQLKESVEYLSKTKTGAIITIENNDNIENLRTDGIKINASISSSLIISIFNKKSPLHDGAIIIKDNKIVYAATYFKITKKSINNKYGARHRAAMGISEICDATTIVVSEETGFITIAKNAIFYPVEISNFQEKLISFIND